VAAGLSLRLRAETLGLILRIVERREAVRVFTPAGEKLEAIGQERIAVRPPRERRHLRRIVRDEDRPAQLRLDVLLEQLELHLAGAVLGPELDAVPLAQNGQRVAVADAVLRQRIAEAAVLEQRV